MESTFKDYLFLHLLVLILGFTAILGRLVEVNPVVLVILRTLIATVVIAALMLLKKQSFTVSRLVFWRLFMVGSILALHWICFFGSARLATVSVSLVTFSTTSFFTSIIEPLSTRKKISGREVLLGSLAVVGIFLIFSFEAQYIEGIIVGLLGSFLVAIYSSSNAIMTHKLPSRLINFYQLLAACIFMTLGYPLFLMFGWLTIDSSIPTYMDWVWIFVLATICTVFPYIAIVTLMKRFSAFTVNLSLNMEPIYGIGIAILIFGKTEHMSTGFYAGAALILSSVILHAYWNKQKKAPQ
jgi:drug/metabolite transporter (DMT)-like permease